MRTTLLRRVTPPQSVAMKKTKTKTILFSTRRASIRGLPWLLEKYDRRRAICSYVSRYRSLIPGLLAEPEPDSTSYITGS